MKNLSVRNEGSDIPCKADVDARLKNVPNVGTNDQKPTYSTAATLAKLVTGEKLGVAFGKIAKAVDELITHLSDSVKHITAEERTAWNGKAAGNHTHSNMTAATASAAGKAGFVPAPAAGEKQRFLKADGTWGNAFTPIVVTQTGTDLNDYITSGIYIFSSAYAPANIPAGSNGWLVVSRSSAEAVKQLWFRLGTPNSNDYSTFVRTRIGSTWSNWRQYATIPPADSAQGKYLRDDGTWQTPPDTNTNNAVTQTDTTTSADYRVLLSNNANDTTETGGAKKSNKLTFNPSSGALYAYGQDRIDITDKTVDIDTYKLDVNYGHPQIMRFICRYNAGASNITNIPVTNVSFILDVELVRRASSTDYTTMQTFRTNAQPTYEYVRYCTNGTWGAWTTRKFTDTTYSEATQLKAGLMPAADKKKLDSGYVVKSDDGGLYVEY